MAHPITRQLLSWIALGAALTPRALAQPDVEALAQAIVGGYSTGNGAVSATALIGECDASLVAEDLLLTAAHCLNENVPTQAWFGHSMEAAVITAPIAYCQAHPGYPTTDGTDIAFCVLSESVTELAPMLLEGNCAMDPSRVEQSSLVLRGHGFVTEARAEERVEREVEVRVDTEQAEGRELVVGDHEHGACNGDSGGSAYRTLGDGDVELVGVISRRGPALDGTDSTNCESTTVVTRVAPHLAWIASSTGAVLSTTCDHGEHSYASVVEPFAAATLAPDGPVTPVNSGTTSCALAPPAARSSRLSYAWTLLGLGMLQRLARARRYRNSKNKLGRGAGMVPARPRLRSSMVSCI